MSVLIGDHEYFPGIPAIPYEGPESDNPLAFKYYDADRVVAGKPMAEHFRFAVAYWHTFNQTGSDPFGPGTIQLPWEAADTAETEICVSHVGIRNRLNRSTIDPPSEPPATTIRSKP